MTEDQKISQAHSGREVIYASLSRIFTEPPGDFIYSMLEALENGLEGMNENNGGPAALGIKGLKDFLRRRRELDEAGLKEFDLDTLRNYTRVFCLTDSVPVSESYYTSPDKIVMQESRDEVMALYKATGFEMDADSNEPEDHLGYEIMFMSFLSKIASKEAAAENWDNLDKILELQKRFLREHLINWTEDFVRKLGEYGEQVGFYGSAALFMLEYLRGDEDFLA